MTPRNPPWTRDELILALELYFRCNPLHTSEKNADIVALSIILNRLPIHADRADHTRFRNPNSVYMKLCNFLRLDPAYEGKGLDAGSKRDVEVWHEFAHDRPRLQATAQAITAMLELDTLQSADWPADEVTYEAPEGRVLLRAHLTRERNASLVTKEESPCLTTGRGAPVCGVWF